MPLNQPLYSLILFAIVPSFMAKRVLYRPPVALWDIFDKLQAVFSDNFDNVVICKLSRKEFLNVYASVADVVIFTGEYENVMRIKDDLKIDALLIFNGGALNPIIVTASAKLDKAIFDIVRERLFNSGQDCMAPCAILIDRKISNTFIKKLLVELQKETVGLSYSAKTTIGQMLNASSVALAAKLLEGYYDKLIFGGIIDPDVRLISPTVFVFDHVSDLPQELMFAPIFLIGVYNSLLEVDDYLSTPIAKKLKGYISIYTENKNEWEPKEIFFNNVLINESLFTYESANREFGGYGLHCSFISRFNKISTRPILISKEIAKAFFNSLSKEKRNGCL
ncbi:hypothetical protein AGMMS50268_38000 [Spirochaetia bacterium]|nr:hypothetical protein AGMMS50268_38000 [Spirochaetia bacterium]